MSSSAYFPNEEATREFANLVVPPVQIKTVNQCRVIEKTAALIEFPAERRILWDRTPEAEMKFIFAKDVLPQLYIPPQATKDIITELANSDKKVIERQMAVIETACCGESERSFITARSFKGVSNPFYVFKSQEVLKSSSSSIPTIETTSSFRDRSVADEHLLTVPINVRSSGDVDLLFAEESTSHMIQNLGKSICSCREFGLRSCIRIRAAGFASQANDQYTAIMRYEVILPNVSFQMTEVRMVPFLDTPLTVQLFRPSLYQPEALANSYHLNIKETCVMKENSSSLSSSSKLKKFGYLTMNRTRKLVPMLENDTSLPTCPLVGVWVSGLSEHGSDPIAHPFVWAACLRFLKYENIHERVFISDNQTFLLVVINGNSYSNYEVRMVPDNSTLHQEYLCADFSVDLVTDTVNYLDDGGSDIYQDAILGTFRPIRRQDQLSTFRSSMEKMKENHVAMMQSINSKSLSQQHIPSSSSKAVVEQDSFTRNAMRSSASSFEELPSKFQSMVAATYDPTRYASLPNRGPEESFTVERNTPLPRRCIPTPYEAPMSPAASIDVDKGDPDGKHREKLQDMKMKSGEDRGENLNAGVSTEIYEAISQQSVESDGHAKMSCAASDIIMAQQLQLDYLRKQVDQLKGIIIDMGGQVPSLDASSDRQAVLIDSSADIGTRDDVNKQPESTEVVSRTSVTISVAAPFRPQEVPTSSMHTHVVVGVGRGKSPETSTSRDTRTPLGNGIKTPEKCTHNGETNRGVRFDGDDSDSPELVVIKDHSFYSADESIGSTEGSVVDSDDEKEVLVLSFQDEDDESKRLSTDAQFFMEPPSIPKLPLLDVPLKGTRDCGNPLKSFTPLVPTDLQSTKNDMNEEDQDIRITKIRNEEQEEEEGILKVRIGKSPESSESVNLGDLETESIASIEARYMTM